MGSVGIRPDELYCCQYIQGRVYKQGMPATIDDLRFPVGPFVEVPPDTTVRQRAIADIAALPARMREAVDGLTDAQLDTAYRPGGWTVRQVVHHVADSHTNAFVRLKLALTEQSPTIKPYDEKAFAGLADMRLPVAVSLDLLASIHARWVAIYASMTDADFSRTFVHPEFAEPQSLERQAQTYGWHSRHHVAHITALRQREGW
jgi:hypothetical protein